MEESKKEADPRKQVGWKIKGVGAVSAIFGIQARQADEEVLITLII